LSGTVVAHAGMVGKSASKTAHKNLGIFDPFRDFD
jgi:hypothetical protein